MQKEYAKDDKEGELAGGYGAKTKILSLPVFGE